jgi:hypothetical protein
MLLTVIKIQWMCMQNTATSSIAVKQNDGLQAAQHRCSIHTSTSVLFTPPATVLHTSGRVWSKVAG